MFACRRIPRAGRAAAVSTQVAARPDALRPGDYFRYQS
jgi:hypothetical protein